MRSATAAARPPSVDRLADVLSAALRLDYDRRTMRLNFWQWLGLILLIAAGSYWIYEQQAERSGRPAQDETTLDGTAQPPIIPPTTLPADAANDAAAP